MTNTKYMYILVHVHVIVLRPYANIFLSLIKVAKEGKKERKKRKKLNERRFRRYIRIQYLFYFTRYRRNNYDEKKNEPSTREPFITKVNRIQKEGINNNKKTANKNPGNFTERRLKWSITNKQPIIHVIEGD